MKLNSIHYIDTPYEGINEADYQIEKKRLQVELLKIQQRLVRENQRLAITFDGRDAAGKGSTIKRFTEFLIPSFFNIVALGIPTVSESKYWFRRYEKHLPAPGNIAFFDRSWYNRALIEPVMGYCTEGQYKYFMKKVLNWEHKQIDQGLLLVKFYLSVDAETQLLRFEDRIRNPLTYWKFSDNDLKARKKWKLYTEYKLQMLASTSSVKSPWVIVQGNKKREARLTCMLHLVRLLGEDNFTPMTGEQIVKNQEMEVSGVKFKGLSLRQIAVLEELQGKADTFQTAKAKNLQASNTE
ncbi:polyphosphate kinase 2 family protein [Thalassotalea litorea]|uniref:polyphosphate kinase 2 n=1 Tax=Thalassotalea litorea TaxID=2020715 RepID=UPI003734FDF5